MRIIRGQAAQLGIAQPRTVDMDALSTRPARCDVARSGQVEMQFRLIDIAEDQVGDTGQGEYAKALAAGHGDVQARRRHVRGTAIEFDFILVDIDMRDQRRIARDGHLIAAAGPVTQGRRNGDADSVPANLGRSLRLALPRLS